jgi:hypothetical protein
MGEFSGSTSRYDERSASWYSDSQSETSICFLPISQIRLHSNIPAIAEFFESLGLWTTQCRPKSLRVDGCQRYLRSMASSAWLKEDTVLSDGLPMMFEMLDTRAKAGVLQVAHLSWRWTTRRRGPNCIKCYNIRGRTPQFPVFFRVPTSGSLSLGRRVCASLPQSISALPPVRPIGKCQRRKKNYSLSPRDRTYPRSRLTAGKPPQARMAALPLEENSV